MLDHYVNFLAARKRGQSSQASAPTVYSIRRVMQCVPHREAFVNLGSGAHSSRSKFRLPRKTTLRVCASATSGFGVINSSKKSELNAAHM